ESILKSFNGIVFLDEAYIDFSDQESLIHCLDLYPNLIVSQTFSKAWGLAAARVGVVYASKEIISFFNKVKPPYNVSGPNQLSALKALKNINTFKENIATIRAQREILENQLSQLGIVIKTYPSDANFLLVEVNNADKIYAHLAERNIITRNRSTMVSNCIRITVGSPRENKILLDELKQLCA
ncbi:MAG: aminotransferase class I/II-fold pyridoxal phosphate-dependent enzyme, partial [Saprospiraceae bacterium]